jgi:hypothetical protein
MRFAVISLKPNWPDIVSFNRKICIFALSFEIPTGTTGVRMLTIEPNGKPEPVVRAKQLETAFQTPDLGRKFNSLRMPPN